MDDKTLHLIGLMVLSREFNSKRTTKERRMEIINEAKDLRASAARCGASQDEIKAADMGMAIEDYSTWLAA